MKPLSCFRIACRLAAFSSLAAFAFSAPSLLSAQGVAYSGSSPAVDYGRVNVCPAGATKPTPCSKTLTLTYKVTASGMLGSPRALTVGAPDLDYNLAGGSTCQGTVTAGTSCSVNVTLAPRYAGERKGAVEIVDATGKLLATTLIHGIGVAPQIAFDPAKQSTVATIAGSEGYPLAADELGFLYIPNSYGDGIIKFPLDGETSTTLGTGLGLSIENGVVLDGAGNFFFPRIVQAAELSADGSTVTTLPFTGAEIPDALAVDGSGDVFLLYDYFPPDVDDLLFAVIELPAGGGPQIMLPFTSEAGTYAEALTVDDRGNVFVSEVLNDGNGPTHIHELPVGGGGEIVLPSNFSAVTQLAVDAAGDLFVGNTPQIVQIPAGETTPIQISNFLAARDSYDNVAVSPSGDVFSSLIHGKLVKLRRSQPPLLSFPETALGTTSIPLSAQIQNIGNAPLSLSGISANGPFALVAGPGTPADCTAGSSLAPGARCNLSMTFTPESGSVQTGTVTLSDDALNDHATHVIPLAGTIGEAPMAKLSSTTLSFGHIPYPAGATLPLTITNIGGGTLTIAPSINGPSYTVTGNTCGAGVAAGLSCALQVTYAPLAIGYDNDVLSLSTNESLNNGPTTLPVPLRALSTGVGALETEQPLNFGFSDPEQGDPPIVLPLTIYNVGVPGNIKLGLQVSDYYSAFSIIGSTCTTGVTAGNSCVVQLQFAPGYDGEVQGTLTITPTSGAAPSTVILLGDSPTDGG